jgi:rare lipoprotein A
VGQTWLQVASFGDKDNAQRLVARLEQASLERVRIEPGEARGNRVWRVRIGPLAGRELAERIAAQVRSLGFGSPALIAE